jgi:hypothetical protein
MRHILAPVSADSLPERVADGLRGASPFAEYTDSQPLHLSKESRGWSAKVWPSKPFQRTGQVFYEDGTHGRSASHHLQVKAALSPLYVVC